MTRKTVRLTPTPARVWLVRFMPVEEKDTSWNLAVALGSKEQGADFMPISDIDAQHFIVMGVANRGEVWDPMDQATWPGDKPCE